MTIVAFLDELHAQGIKLWLEDERLRFRAPQEAMTPEVRAAIAQRRDEIIAFLRQARATDQPQQATIPVVPRNGPLPLSFAQERLWFLDQWQPNSATYNIPMVARICGQLDHKALEASIAAVIARHESLRTRFEMLDGQPIQIIDPYVPFTLPWSDLRTLPVEVREREVQQRIAAEARQFFDLATGPLLCAHLLQVSDQEHLLLLTLHHIVADGWSTPILVQEIGAHYQARCSGMPANLPPLPIQYADFAVWQRQRLQGAALERLHRYWRQQLQGAPALIELPTDYPRPLMQSFRGAVLPFTLPPALTADLKVLCQREDVTLFMTLLTTFQILLARLSGQHDIVVGSPIANRTHVAIKGLIGFFVNTLVLRSSLSGNPSGVEALHRVRKTCLEAYDHQELPFERLIDLLQLERSTSHNPLVQVVLSLQNAPFPDVRLPNLTLSLLNSHSATAKFDLNLSFVEIDDTLHGQVEYSTDLFTAATIERLAQQFQLLLQSLVANPQQPISRLPLLTPAERQARLAQWSTPQRQFPVEAGLSTLFEAQVARTPDAIALVSGDEQLSYAVLNRWANQLAHFLQAQGVGPGQFVGLFCERSPTLLIAILAIVKAGAAYVPLDPAYPAERIAMILHDAQVTLLITEQEHVLPQLADAPPCRVLAVEALAHELSAQPTHNPVCRTTPRDCAYVIYTSGSTGRPKGTLVTHANVVRLFAATNDWFHFGPQDVWTLFHSVAFDFSVWEIWGALLYGGRLVVVPYLTSRAPDQFAQLLATAGVTVLNQTPSAFRQLIPAVAQLRAQPRLALRYVIFGGEALDLPSLRPWFARHGDQQPQLVNMYGITETTVHVTYRPVREADCRAGARSVIGGPIPDLQLYLLDAEGQPVPPGVPGELYVGGAGVSQGYLNRPDLTAQRFLPDPFSGVPGTRLYRSGDVARGRTDGEIEYLGRSDQQVKLRGFRIELGEIEAALMQYPAVREAVVLPCSDRGAETRLVAYLTSQTDIDAIHLADLRAFLSTYLPDYMIPALFVRLDALPLTPNGKLDRAALPAPDSSRPALDQPFVLPRNPAEATLAAIWAQVLGVDRVGIHDNFFALGGDSIRSVQVLAQAREQGINLSLPDLFQRPTIAALCADLVPTADAPAPPVLAPFSLISAEDRARLPVGIEDAYPLSALQSGMIFHSVIGAAQGIYHDVFSFHMRFSIDVVQLQVALDQLAALHPLLRTAFDLHHFHEPLQLVYAHGSIPLAVTDLRDLSLADADAAVAAWVAEERLRPFDWSQPPLLRFHVHQRSTEAFQLSLSFHHAILDGWSVASLLTELIQRYRRLIGDPDLPLLPPPTLHFRDYIAMERQALESAELRAFWQRKLHDRTLTTLPRWPQPPAVPDEPQTTVRRVPIPLAVSDGLYRVARQANVPLKSVLLAAHLRVLALLSAHDEVITGLVMHGRPETSSSERMIGLFLNTLPLRMDLREGTWLDLAQRAFEAERELLPARYYPLAEIQRLMGNEPLFEVIFNFTNFHVYDQVNAASGVELLDTITVARTNFALTANFGVNINTNAVTLRLDYDPAQLPAAQMQRIGDYYLQALTALATQPSAFFHTAPLLSSAERQQLLVAWNRTHPISTAHTLPDLIEAQVAATPQAIAIADAGGSLSYAALSQQANRLAHYLRDLGVTAETPVIVCLERSAQLLVAVLAIWKANAAYVPLDPTLPPQRLQAILAATGASVVLTQTQFQAAFAPTTAHLVCLDALPPTLPEASPQNPPRFTQPAQLAYIIFTSGSTGTPKGVMISHMALHNLAQALAANITPPHGGPLRISFNAPLFFDSSLKQLVQLARGHTLVIVPEVVRQDAQALLAFIHQQRLDWFDCTPTQLRMLLLAGVAEQPALLPPLLLIGGEALDRATWQFLATQPTTRAYNVYGPTECTVDASLSLISTESPVPVIGRALPNVPLYVLDQRLQPVPVGVPGELTIGGVQVARGYLHRPDLTAERFVPDPFSATPGARLYRSGDRVRYLPDGTLEFLGRIDQQVKIRGYRIELGEIEAALSRHPAVQQCVVLVREDLPGDKRLVAYIVASPDQQADTDSAALGATLRAFLKAQLPDYMLPSAFVQLDALPLTPNGKLDRKALPHPSPDQGATGRSANPPRDGLELRLSQLWESLLGVSSIGRDDDFFALGGHSLLAVRLTMQVAQQFGVQLPLATFFQDASIARIAEFIRTQDATSAFSPLVPIRTSGTQPPLFLVHPAGGDVLCYRDLSERLGPDQPIYGLQAVGLYGEQPPDTSVEAMAARYIAALQAQHPHGPYLLAGWSLGGVVAFEMACQLQAQGHTIAALILIDSRLVRPDEPELTDLLLLHAFAQHLGVAEEHLVALGNELAACPAEERVATALHTLQHQGLLPADLSLAQISARFAVFQAHVRAARQYVPRSFAGAISLMQAQDGTAADGGRIAERWASLSTGGITIHTVPGNHFSILRSPHVSLLSTRVQECLEHHNVPTV